MTKSQAGAESVCLNDMGSTCGVKKMNGCSGAGSSGDESSRDSGGVCFPSPYDLTKLSNCENSGMETVTLVRHGQTTPLKPANGEQQQHQQEPMYATVKRTARGPRNECHVYQYPLTIQGTLVTQDCFDSEMANNIVGPPSSTAFLFQDDSGDKNLNAVPLLISEDGRRIAIDSFRRTNNCQTNFRNNY